MKCTEPARTHSAKVCPVRKRVRAPNWAVDITPEPGTPYGGALYEQGDVLWLKFDPAVDPRSIELDVLITSYKADIAADWEAREVG